MEDPKPGETFTCAMCGGTFENETPPEERRAEYERIFHQPLESTPNDIVCHACWLAMGLDKLGENPA